jgi:hypothetical protein
MKSPVLRFKSLSHLQEMCPTREGCIGAPGGFAATERTASVKNVSLSLLVNNAGTVADEDGTNPLQSVQGYLLLSWMKTNGPKFST